MEMGNKKQLMHQSRNGSSFSLTEEGVLETKRENVGGAKFHLYNINEFHPIGESVFKSKK